MELVARRMRVLAEPTRIRLLDHLREGEQSVNELATKVGAGQQNVSKHLGVMTEAGVLARRKSGNHVYYRVVDDSALRLCEQVCGSVTRRLQTLTAAVGGEGRGAPR